MQVSDLLKTYPGRFRPEKAGADAIKVHFDLTGKAAQKFTVEINALNCVVYQGLQGKADCTLHADAGVYISLETGTLTPQTALLQGLIRVDNPGIMTRFLRCFRPLYTSQDAAAAKAKKKTVEDRKPANGPLKGIRILDLSRLLPGPMAGMLLADMGAEVIKIEHPSEPDYIRAYPPRIDSESAFYMAVNRSKKSLALDTSSEEGKAVLLKLVKTADVLIESFRPGILDAQGLGYEALSAVNPSLVFLSLTGYGQSGPYAKKAGHDLNYMGYSGILSLTGDSTGQPVHPGIQLADLAGGAYMACTGVLAALVSAIRNGKGQHIDLAMTEAVIPMAVLSAADYFATGNIAERGTLPLSGGLANYAIYQTSDEKYMVLGALEPKFWNRFCEAAGKPEWTGRIVPGPDRHAALRADLISLFRSKTRQEWTTTGSKHDCCLSPLLELDEVESDPHHLERGMIVDVDGIKGIGPPIRFLGTPASPSWKAPALGQDSMSVLKELGISAAEQDMLVERGIVKC